MIKLYNTDYDYIINDPLSSFQIFPNNWCHVAMSSNILHTTNSFLKVNNVRKEVQCQVVGVQESYDRSRIFLGQTYANKIMGYNLTSDEQTNTKAWFNDILDKFNKFPFKINPAFNSTFDFEGKTSINVKTTTTSRFIYNLSLD
ncbi:hypothetical protein P344_05325 [Spiroplasma mirum ATCC 29335]|uniref:Uncharacterized protein n=1 Tax=Spiroplasma mirum ATCC 29335 TaxID=838561 RepID=W6AMH9_9MOLU|nr:hypothetical protein P344_05325 [Spiroplasma mirum ATCC 29335]